MKIIIAVLIVKAIINMVEKNKAVTEVQHESRGRVIHPAEFEIR